MLGAIMDRKHLEAGLQVQTGLPGLRNVHSRSSSGSHAPSSTDPAGSRPPHSHTASIGGENARSGVSSAVPSPLSTVSILPTAHCARSSSAHRTTEKACAPGSPVDEDELADDVEENVSAPPAKRARPAPKSRRLIEDEADDETHEPMEIDSGEEEYPASRARVSSDFGLPAGSDSMFNSLETIHLSQGGAQSTPREGPSRGQTKAAKMRSRATSCECHPIVKRDELTHRCQLLPTWVQLHDQEVSPVPQVSVVLCIGGNRH
jgi:hypothetical protein